jgi:hypothetical protein
MAVTKEWNPTPEEKGDTFTPEGDDGGIVIPEDFSPDFLAELAKLAPEDKAAAEKAEAERLAAEKEAADKAEVDRIAAEKLAAEEKELEGKGFIPKGRFNEINNEKKAAEEKAAAAEAENKTLKEQLELAKKGKIKPEIKPDPLDLMEEKVVELDLVKQAALTDYGFDSDEYRQAVKDYNRGQRQLMQMESDVQAGKAVAGLKGENAAYAATKSELNEVAEAAYEVYPFLNKNGENFDETAINDVLEYRNELIDAVKSDGSRKYTPAEALQKAIDKLAPFHAARIGVKVPDGETEIQKAVREKRAQGAAEKAAAATRNQPAFVKGRTDEGGFKLDVNKMTADEIAKLPKDVQDRLLGNTLDEKDQQRAA